MIFGVGRVTGYFVLNRIEADHFSILRSHGGSVNLLVIEGGHIGTSPIFALVLNGRFKVVGVFNVEFHEPGHIGRVLTGLAGSLLKALDDLLEGVSLPVTSGDDAIAIFTGHPGAARSKGGVVDRNRRSRRRIEPGFFGPVVLPFKGDLFTTPKLAYEVNSFYQARLAFLIFRPRSCG